MSDGQCGSQHGGSVPAPASTRPDVVADVATDVEQKLVELVPDGNPGDVLVAVNPPQRRARDVPGRAGRLGKRLGPQLARVV